MRIYSIKEAFKNVWRNGMMSLASITSVAAALLILGVILMLIVNINALTEGAKNQFDTVTAYLKDDMTKEQVVQIGEEIGNIPHVQAVIFETKEQALENFRKDWGDNAYLLDNLDENNPLPNTFIIKVDRIENANSVSLKLKEIEGFEEVKYYGEVIDKILKISQYMRNLGFFIILFLTAIAVLIINNTIRLAINARKREITIMRYVGATSWFIRWPFILEGTILGVVGALIATGAVYLIYGSVYSAMASDFYMVIAAYIVNTATVLKEVLYINLILGVGIGSLGSILSIRRYLRA